MKPKFTDMNTINLILDKYTSGYSCFEIAKEFGCSRPTIDGILKRNGIKHRSFSDAMKLRMSKATPEYRKAITNAAHIAKAGVPESFESKLKRALTMEARGICTSGSSVGESKLAEALSAKGIPFKREVACGIYNIDFVVYDFIAVEIEGSGFKFYGEHGARRAERIKQVLSSGYTYVSCLNIRRTQSRFGRSIEIDTDYIIAFLEQICRDEAMRGKYWMIRGNTNLISASIEDIDKVATVYGPKRS